VVEFFFKCVENSFSQAKELLWPVRLKVWLTLFVLYAVTGGCGTFSGIQVPSSPGFLRPPAQESEVKTPPPSNFQKIFPRLGPQREIHQWGTKWAGMARNIWRENRRLILTLAACFVGILIMLGILWLWLSSRLQMVLLQSLLTRDVRTISHWTSTKGLGDSFFKFNLLLFFLEIVPLIAVAGPVWGGFLKGALHFKTHWLFLSALAIALFIYLLAVGVMAALARIFLPPFMLMTQQDAFASLRALWRRDWEDWARGSFYCLLYGVIVVGLGIAAAIALIVAAIPLALVSVLVALGGALTLKGLSLALKAVFVGGGLVLGVSMGILLLLAIQVPVQTVTNYLRIALARRLTEGTP